MSHVWSFNQRWNTADSCPDTGRILRMPLTFKVANFNMGDYFWVLAFWLLIRLEERTDFIDLASSKPLAYGVLRCLDLGLRKFLAVWMNVFDFEGFLEDVVEDLFELVERRDRTVCHVIEVAESSPPKDSISASRDWSIVDS